MARQPRKPTLAFGTSPVETACQRQFGVDAVFAHIKYREQKSKGRGSFYAAFHIDGDLSQLHEDYKDGRIALGLSQDKFFETWIAMSFQPFFASQFIDQTMSLIAGWERREGLITLSPSAQRVCVWYVRGTGPV